MSIEQDKWNTDGVIVWRGENGLAVCAMRELSVADGTMAFLPIEHQRRYARLIARAPELVAALRECVDRFEACCRQGSDPDYAALAVQRYRVLLAEIIA